jgi:hypothetical protein
MTRNGVHLIQWHELNNYKPISMHVNVKEQQKWKFDKNKLAVNLCGGGLGRMKPGCERFLRDNFRTFFVGHVILSSTSVSECHTESIRLMLFSFAKPKANCAQLQVANWSSNTHDSYNRVRHHKHTTHTKAPLHFQHHPTHRTAIMVQKRDRMNEK